MLKCPTTAWKLRSVSLHALADIMETYNCRNGIIHFEGNKALGVGSVLFGGQVQYWVQLLPSNINYSAQSDNPSLISSEPYQVCLC